MGAVEDILKEAEDQLVFGVKAEGGGGDEEISDVGSSLAGVGVEGEEGVQLSDVFRGEHGILDGDVLAQNSPEFLFLDLLLGHDES